MTFEEIERIKEAKGIERYFGLMFKTNPEPLLFKLRKEKIVAINSMFCKVDFIALWFDKNKKLLEVKLIKPGRLKILPKKPFQYLIEIPINRMEIKK